MKVLNLIVKGFSWILGTIMLFLLIIITTLIIFKNMISENTIYQVIRDMDIIENGIGQEESQYMDYLYNELNLKMTKNNLVKLIDKSKLKKETDLYVANIINKTIGLTDNNFDFSEIEKLQSDLVNLVDKKETLNNEQKDILDNAVQEIVDNSKQLVVDNKVISEDAKVWIKKIFDFLNDGKYIIISIIIIIACFGLIALINYNFIEPTKITGFVSLGLGIIYIAVWLLSIFLLNIAKNDLEYNILMINSVKNKIDLFVSSIGIISLIIGISLTYLAKRMTINKQIKVEKNSEKSII